MLGAIYEFERANLLERQREGIAIAVEAGKYKGRQVKKIDEKTFDKLYAQYQSREINKVQFAKALSVSRPTLDKLLKDRKNSPKYLHNIKASSIILVGFF